MSSWAVPYREKPIRGRRNPKKRKLHSDHRSDTTGCGQVGLELRNEEMDAVSGPVADADFPACESYIAPACDLASLGERLSDLRRQEVCLDVALKAFDGVVRAHRIVLVAGSPYFARVLGPYQPTQHLHDFPTNLIRSMVDLLYGEVTLVQKPQRSQFEMLLDLCEIGFLYMDKQEPSVGPSLTPPPSDSSTTDPQGQASEQPCASATGVKEEEGEKEEEEEGEKEEEEEEEEDECVVVEVKEPPLKRPRHMSGGDIICCEDESIVIGSDEELEESEIGERQLPEEAVVEGPVEARTGCSEANDSGVAADDPNATEAWQETVFKFGVPEHVDHDTVQCHKGCIFVGHVNLDEAESRRRLILDVAGENPEWLELKQERVRKYFCSECDFNTDQEALAEQHGESHEVRPSFRCTVCNLAFFTHKRLDRHQKEEQCRLAGGNRFQGENA